MSNPGDNIRNSLVRRSFNHSEKDGSNYLPSTVYGGDDNKNEREMINNAASIDEIDSVKEEKRPFLNQNSSAIDEDDVKYLRRDGLKPIHFAAYAVGHVYNDL